MRLHDDLANARHVRQRVGAGIEWSLRPGDFAVFQLCHPEHDFSDRRVKTGGIFGVQAHANHSNGT
jgi:hypothetical protein